MPPLASAIALTSITPVFVVVKFVLRRDVDRALPDTSGSEGASACAQAWLLPVFADAQPPFAVAFAETWIEEPELTRNRQVDRDAVRGNLLDTGNRVGHGIGVRRGAPVVPLTQPPFATA